MRLEATLGTIIYSVCGSHAHTRAVCVCAPAPVEGCRVQAHVYCIRIGMGSLYDKQI